MSAEKSGDKSPAKGIRKVNLSDLQGKLNKRGRESFHDDELKASLMELLNSENSDEAFIWVDGFVDPTLKEKAKVTLSAKFRNRVTSVAKQITNETGKALAITVRYTRDGEMVVSKRNA